MATYQSKHVGGLAAVAMIGNDGRVVTIDIHYPSTNNFDTPCEYLGGAPCSVGTSALSRQFEGRVLTRAEIDEALRLALRRALVRTKHTRYMRAE